MSELTPDEVLALVPQQRPFRFVERLLEVDAEHILGVYTWTEEDCRGYSMEGRLVPQFALLEMAAQIGNVAWCIYHMSARTDREEMRHLVGVFTQVERAVFHSPVRPGQTIACFAEFGEEGYFRGTKLVSEVQAQVRGGPDDGRAVFSGVISGMWVPRSQGELIA